MTTASTPRSRRTATRSSSSPPPNGRAQLWRRRVDTERAEPIAGTEGGHAPAWSADGRTIAFLAAGRLKTISRAGGAVRDLGSRARRPRRRGTRRRLAGVRPHLCRVADAPARRRHDGRDGAAARRPRARVAGASARRLRLRRRARGRTAGDASGGQRHHARSRDHRRSRDRGRLDPAARPRRRAAGPALRRQHRRAHRPRDTGRERRRRRRRAGARRPHRRGCCSGRPARRRAGSCSGSTATARAARRRGSWRLLAGAGVARTIAPPPSRMLEPQLRTLDVYLLPLVPGAVASGLTLALAADTDPVWAPDGAPVLFRSLQGGTAAALFMREAGVAGAAIEELMAPVGSGRRAHRLARPAPARRNAVSATTTARHDTDVMLLDPSAGIMRPVAALRASTSPTAAGRPTARGSPTCRTSSDSPTCSCSRGRPGGAYACSRAGGVKPRWGADGRRALLLRGTEMLRVTVSPVRRHRCRHPPGWRSCPGLRDFDVAHDARAPARHRPAPGDPRRPTVRALVDWQTGRAMAALPQ